MSMPEHCWVIVNETIPSIFTPGTEVLSVTKHQRPIVASHKSCMRLWARTLGGNEEKIDIRDGKLLDFLGFLADLGVGVAEDFDGIEFTYKCA